MAMPLFWIKTDTTALETGVEAVIHNSVSITVTREHLNLSLDAVKLKLVAIETVADLVFLHPLIGIVTTLCCHGNHLGHLT